MFTPMTSDPILNIQWVHVDDIQRNDWNPNVVMSQELKLLEYNLLKEGWIQPVLGVKLPDTPGKYMLIDGFHRCMLSTSSKRVMEMYQGKVPMCVLDKTVPQAMLLTVRINRAKGSHVAFKMSDMVRRLIEEFKVPVEQIEQEIGAYKGEVELLAAKDVFTRKKLEGYGYTQGWKPKDGKNE